MIDAADAPPDRLDRPRQSLSRRGRAAADVGVRFKGVERTNVEEYCVSEGWVRLAAGAAKDRHGRPLTIKVSGVVEPYFRDTAK